MIQDVMDEQKVSSCSFSLFQALAELADDIGPAPAAMAAEIDGVMNEPDDPEENMRLALADQVHVLTEGLDPKLSYRKAVSGVGGVIVEWELTGLQSGDGTQREVMTR